MLDKETKDYLDKMPDDEFIFYLHMRYGVTMPIWERCSKEEYEAHSLKETDGITFKDILRVVGNVYRRVPIWHNGGGLLDQISGKEPDDYYYEKQIGSKKCLALGHDMLEYCRTRECMKPYFEES